MDSNLLHEIIQLKEERKIFEVVCGNNEIAQHIFNKNEQARMRSLRNDTISEIILEDVQRNLHEDERSFRETHR